MALCSWGNREERMAASLALIFNSEAPKGYYLNTPESEKVHTLVQELAGLNITMDPENPDYARSIEIVNEIHQVQDRSTRREAFNYLSAAWIRTEEEFILRDLYKNPEQDFSLFPLCFMRSTQLNDPNHGQFVAELRAA